MSEHQTKEKESTHGNEGDHQKDVTAGKSIVPRKSSIEVYKAGNLANEDKGLPEENKELDLPQNGRRGSKKLSSINNIDGDKKPGSPEFNSLKDIDGNVIRHDESDEEEPEDPNQKVHFKLEEPQEETTEEPSQPHLNKKPRKSILKRSLSFKSAGSTDKKDSQIDISEQTNTGETKPGLITDSIEFLSAWKEIRHDMKTLERFFLNQAKPEDFSAIFAHGIEIELLSEIIATTNNLSEVNSELALKVLENLTEIKDFEEVSKSLSDKEKIDIHTIFMKLRALLNLGEESLTSISGKYFA